METYGTHGCRDSLIIYGISAGPSGLLKCTDKTISIVSWISLISQLGPQGCLEPLGNRDNHQLHELP